MEKVQPFGIEDLMSVVTQLLSFVLCSCICIGLSCVFLKDHFALFVITIPTWQIRTLEMLKSRFQSLPGAFNANLVSRASDDKAHAYRQYFSLLKHYKSLDRSYSNLQHHKVETSVNEESHSQEAKVLVFFYMYEMEVCWTLTDELLDLHIPIYHIIFYSLIPAG